MRFLVLVLLVSPSAVAQEITTWRSQSGTEIRAEFRSIDTEKKTVTLLIEKTIPIDQLDRYSQAKARILGNDKKLFPGLTTPLKPDITLSEWKAATESDRRAHIAFLVIATKIQDQTTMGKLHEFAEFMHKAVSGVAETRDPQLPDPRLIGVFGSLINGINQYSDKLRSEGKLAP